MKISQLQLYVLICCGAAVADLVTDLGSDVIINCDLDENDVYWIFLKIPDPPTVILRSFSTTTSPHYLNKTFRKKYSVKFKHRLVINNVTSDELGVYYCMDAVKEPKFSNSTRIEQSQLTECRNQTVLGCTHQNQTQLQIIVFIFGVLFGFLVIVLIGLLKVFAVRYRGSLENSRQLQTNVTEQDQEPDQLQYAEVDFTKLRRNIRSSQINSTYAALNLPRS